MLELLSEELGEWRREAAQCTRGMGREGEREKRNWVGGGKQGGSRSGNLSECVQLGAGERNVDDMAEQPAARVNKICLLKVNKR